MQIDVPLDLDLEVYCLSPPTGTPTNIYTGAVSKIIATVAVGQIQSEEYYVRNAGGQDTIFPGRRIFTIQAEAQRILDIIA